MEIHKTYFIDKVTKEQHKYFTVYKLKPGFMLHVSLWVFFWEKVKSSEPNKKIRYMRHDPTNSTDYRQKKLPYCTQSCVAVEKQTTLLFIWTSLYRFLFLSFCITFSVSVFFSLSLITYPLHLFLNVLHDIYS